MPTHREAESAIPSAFPLVRYYTAGSIAVIVAAVVAVNLISSRVERNTVVERLTRDTQEAALPGVFSFAEQLSLRAGSLGIPEGIAVADENWADRTVFSVYRGWPLARFDLLSGDGEQLYSTVPDGAADAEAQLSDSVRSELAFGQPVTDYQEDHKVTLLNGEMQSLDTVSVYVPYYAEGTADPAAAPSFIFLVTRDVTSSVDTAVASASTFRAITVTLTMSVMFFALLFIVWRGQRFSRQIRDRLAVQITRQRELSEELDSQNEALREAGEAKSRFLSLVSHELRTPLTSVLAFSDVLKKNKEGNLNERQLKHLAVINRSGQHLKLLIDDLLDIARIDAGKFTLEKGQVDLGAVVHEVSESVSQIFAGKDQVLNINVPHALPAVSADRARISQVLLNLLSNASKYSPAGTQTSITCEHRQGAVHVAVTDAGIGISENDQKQLFSMFFRADNAQTRSVPGTGLGLHIVRTIVEMHGGEIKVSSKPGAGSTFEFWLPVAAAQAQDATPRPAALQHFKAIEPKVDRTSLAA